MGITVRRTGRLTELRRGRPARTGASLHRDVD